MSPAFNLVDEPWIAVRMCDGSSREVGLLDVFAEAHQIDRLAGELPTQDVAVMRILLAIAYRALAPVKLSEPVFAWDELQRASALPASAIRDYLETWRDRFELFDPVRPFFQVPDLRNAKDTWKGLEVLVPDCPGPNAMFRRRDPSLPLRPAEAARWLVHAQSWDVSGIKSGALGDSRVKGGRGYPTPVGWCGWMGVQVVEGDSLRDTILLNLVLGRDYDVRDIPIWEESIHMTSSERPAEVRGPFGQLGLLTWPARRIRLHEDSGEVVGVLVCNGDPIEYTQQSSRELSTAWRHSAAQSSKAREDIYMPRSLTQGRALWRGLESLLPHANPEPAKGAHSTVPSQLPSGVIRWIDTLTTSGALPPDFRIRLHAVSMVYGPQMAVVETVISDRLVFAATLTSLSGSVQREAATTAVAEVDASVRALRNLANNLATAAGGDPGGAGERAEAAAFDEIDPLFRRWLAEFGPETNATEHHQRWRDDMRALLNRHANALVTSAPDTAWSGREHNGRVFSVGRVSAWFRSALAKALPRPTESPDSRG